MPKTKGILGRKIGMTRVYDENGRSIPVTVIEAGPCTILQKKTVQKEGYNAIQLGFLEKKESKLNKPEAGHFKRSGGKGFYHVREFRVENPESYEVGQQVTLTEMAAIGDMMRFVTGMGLDHSLEDAESRIREACADMARRVRSEAGVAEAADLLEALEPDRRGNGAVPGRPALEPHR